MNSQKAKYYKKLIIDHCKDNNVPEHMWNRAWKRFKKIYNSDKLIKEEMDNDPYITVKTRFSFKGNHS